jgi:tetratricopeptide (TPR) repeat protein
MTDVSTDSTRRRVIRVFVSSTFRDMKEEREELVKHIFPQLRRLCEKRGVVWGEVDLRWGITDEERAEGKVLPICLEEIHECRPYFIGLLGERYGHIPREIPDELIYREPWLKENKRKSVTELEILHGVLNNPEIADNAFFYFRDPAYGKDKASDVDTQHRQKLLALKDRIRRSGLPVRENYPDPKSLGALVYEDLKTVIDQRFAEGSELGTLDCEALEHEAFAQAKHRIYIGRNEYFASLNEHVESDSQPLVLLGESGSGKSALLANWAVKYRDKHPDNYILMHFIGSTPFSSDWAAMLRRIMGEFKRWFDISGDIPTDTGKLRTAFANWLHMASAAAGHRNSKVILVLDALNQLEDRDQAPDLVWLPPFIPENIRMILSTLPGRSLDDLNKRKWPTMLVEPLQDNERKQLIKDYLAQYRKNLSEKRVDKIASADQTRNPLYLRAFLEELRIFGEHALLDDRIDHYLQADIVPALYEKIFERYEEDYERDRPGLVKDALTSLWASRRGLSETELLDLLGSKGESLPQAYWAPFYIAADKLFVNRSGLIGFSHDYLRQAIKDRYIKHEDGEKSAHLLLADYFSNQGLNSRTVDELPWQLAIANEWKRLHGLLADLEFFKAAWGKDQFEVKRYWSRIENGSELKMVDAFREVTDSPSKISDSDVLIDLSLLLTDAGHPQEALSILKFLVGQSHRTGDLNRLQKCLGRQGRILIECGDLDGAMDHLNDQDKICHELNDTAALSSSLRMQANICYFRGDLDGAMKLNKESEQICRELGDSGSLQKTLGNQALILHDHGDFDGAMKLHKEEERICRELGDPGSLSRSLGNQAVILKDRGDLDGAMKLHKEEEQIYRDLGYPAGLSRSIGNQAVILHDRGDLDGAMKLRKIEERICREIDEPEGLQTSLGNQALILQDRGDLDGAMKLLKDQERICREIGDPAGLSRSLGYQASMLHDRGDLDGAMKLQKEVERICRELGNPVILRSSLGKQARILRDRGDLDGAMKLHKEEEQICRELGDSSGLSTCLLDQALIFTTRGDLNGAMDLLKEQERICRELGLVAELSESLNDQSKIMAKQGHFEEALKLAEEAYRLATEHGYAPLAAEIKPSLDDIRSRLADQQ